MKLVITELESPEKGSQSICLNMIVKNEAHIIGKTLKNICENVPITYWVISDTGSTDNTKEIIQKFFDEKNIKGEMFDDKWEDFGHNRSVALKHAYNKTDYLLIFDADDFFHGTFKLPPKLTNDMYSFKFGDPGNNFLYNRPLLINNRKRFEFKGVLHEYLSPMEGADSPVLIDGKYGVQSGKEGDRSKDPDKYKKDAKILSIAFEKEKNESMKNRYAFYCAQSYKDCGNREKAIEWYKKVLGRNNWAQEKYYAALTIGHLYNAEGNKDKALHFWLKTMDYDMMRIEGVVCACQEYQTRGMHNMVVILYEAFKYYKDNLGEPADKLFLDNSKYNYALEILTTISAAYSIKPTVGYTLIRDLILGNKLQPHIMNLCINNFLFYLKYFTDEKSLLLFYTINTFLGKQKMIVQQQIPVWDFLFKKVEPILTRKKKVSIINKEKPNIIITFTTCKRFDLFTKTVNSLLNHWGDYDKIDYWFCVDDNSSEEDRQKMKTEYPWIDYYMKSKEEKGHRESMNIIWNKLSELKPTYWIHMEDDFLFHERLNYIEKGIRGLTKFKNKSVKQVLFNRNYGETIGDYKIKGHDELDEEFCIHKHHTKVSPFPNCNYWPHFSFRPSIVDVETVLKLGNFDSENQFFEMDYARKWTKEGYKSAFFNMITNRHTGKLTSEKSGDKANAYKLNDEEQFNRAPKKESKSTESIDGFIFIPDLDQMGNDIGRLDSNKLSRKELVQQASKMQGCIAINTLGFVKNRIDKLEPSPYFRSGDGIYIKVPDEELKKAIAEEVEMDKKNGIIRVQMLSNWWSSGEKLCEEWSNMCEKDNLWKNIRMVSNDQGIDYHVILNSPPHGAKYDPKKTMVFQIEPWVENPTYNWGVKTWGEWATPDPTKFLEVRGRKTEHHNTAFWQLELPLPDIINLKYDDKIPTISSICSSKYFDVGHIHRVDFLKFLEDKGDVPLDIFNKDNHHKFKNYRGKKTPYVDKSTGIVPYKYYFMVENNYERNFITEKVWEPILCETLVFYAGCPNVTDYIDKDAFVLLDMNDFEKSYQIIKTAIAEDWWSKRIDVIRKMKKKILDQLGFFPTIKQIIDSRSASNNRE